VLQTLSGKVVYQAVTNPCFLEGISTAVSSPSQLSQQDTIPNVFGAILVRTPKGCGKGQLAPLRPRNECYQEDHQEWNIPPRARTPRTSIRAIRSIGSRSASLVLCRLTLFTPSLRPLFVSCLSLIQR